jgi:hypothetical protein
MVIAKRVFIAFHVFAVGVFADVVFRLSGVY